MLWLPIACKLVTKEPEISGEPVDIQVRLTTSEHVPSVILAEVTSNSAKDYTLHVYSDGNTLHSETFNTENQTEIPILGVKPGAQAMVTVQSSERGQTIAHQDSIQAGALSSTIGTLNFDVTTNTLQEGYFLISLFSQIQTMALIIDTNGNILWGMQQGDDENGGVDVQLAPDGESIWMNLFPVGDDRSATKLQEVALDGEIIDSIDVTDAHHLFDTEGDDGFLWLTYDLRETQEFGNVCGDRLMKYTPALGSQEIFTTWDWLTLYQSGSWNFGIPQDCFDWTHANGILYDQSRDSYLMSFAGVDIIMELDKSGVPIQILGGISALDSDYTYAEPSDAFSYPHGASWGSNGEILVLSTVNEITEAAGYVIEADELVKVWSFGSEYGHNALNLGEVSQITPEYRMINWGSVGRLQVVDETNTVVFDMLTDFGYWVAEAEYLPNLPLMRP